MGPFGLGTYFGARPRIPQAKLSYDQLAFDPKFANAIASTHSIAANLNGCGFSACG